MPVYPKSQLFLRSITTTRRLFLAANSKRRGFVIFPNNANPFFIGNVEMMNSSDGALINVGTIPVHMCAYIHGDWVQQEIHCFALATFTVGVLEILEPE